MTPRTASLAAAIAAASPSYAERIESAAWDTLAAIDVQEIITNDSYQVRKVFPSAIKDGVAQFDITGFVVPLGGTTNVRDLMLVSDMGFCPFCGSPEHGTSLQVSLSAPLPVITEGMRLTLRGSLEPVTDDQTWQSAIMVNAQIIDG
ncbi:hypothetical protein [Yoonia sp.]|uniref:hypothetical protein n=1 Tax=Yoonia sp. TaxID=2212373 RepID=UPI003F6D3E48